MKAKQVWAIVPFSRPKWLNNVINNFTLQTFQNKKIVIVENGDAIGSCKKYGFEPDLLLTSEKHQAIAKATALNELKRINAEYWTTWDDDDYYGYNYLQELIENSDKADIIGKNTYFVKTQNDKLRLFGSNVENTNADLIHGPTISSWVAECTNFENVGRWSEDIAFLQSMKNKGANIFATSRWNFINQRHKSHGHTWTITDKQMAQGWLHTVDGAYINEYHVNMEYAKQFINQLSVEPNYTRIEKTTFTLEDSAAYTFARKQAGSMEDWMKHAAKQLGVDKTFGIG